MFLCYGVLLLIRKDDPLNGRVQVQDPLLVVQNALPGQLIRQARFANHFDRIAELHDDHLLGLVYGEQHREGQDTETDNQDAEGKGHEPFHCSTPPFYWLDSRAEEPPRSSLSGR